MLVAAEGEVGDDGAMVGAWQGALVDAEDGKVAGDQHVVKLREGRQAPAAVGRPGPDQAAASGVVGVAQAAGGRRWSRRARGGPLG